MILMVGIASRRFIHLGMRYEATQILLQINEYTPEKKQNSDLIDKISPIYWLTVTMIYLTWSFISYNWSITWIIWLIAGLFFALIVTIINSIEKK